jgi:hypothetical protein
MKMKTKSELPCPWRRRAKQRPKPLRWKSALRRSRPTQYGLEVESTPGEKR